MERKIKVIADTIHYDGEEVARITCGPVVRDNFLDAISDEGIGSLEREQIMKMAREKSQARAITLDELADILNKVMGV